MFTPSRSMFGKALHNCTLSDIIPLGCKTVRQNLWFVFHISFQTVLFALYILDINTWLREAEWHICLIWLTKDVHLLTKDVHLIFQTSAANKECLRSRSSASYRHQKEMITPSQINSVRHAHLRASRFTLSIFVPSRCMKTKARDETKLWDWFSVRTLCTVLHIIAHSI